MKKIAVIGRGTAGIQALCHLLAFVPNDFHIYSIYDPDIPFLGIGESTNPSFTSALFYGLDFLISEDLASLGGTYKYGTKLVNWRHEPFVNPFVSGFVGIHFDTFLLADFAYSRLHSLWRGKFSVLTGTVLSLATRDDFAFVRLDDEELSFDYVVDCRGLPENYAGYSFVNDAVNHCLVHNKRQPSLESSYTYHTATLDGWMFSIPLANRDSFGYLFNDSITDRNTARINFSNEINISVDALDDISYGFKSFYSETLIEGRVIKNGNRAVFFEPLFANSLWIYDQINRITVDLVQENFSAEQLNRRFREKAKSVFDMICFYYHGGSIYNTDFWNYASTMASSVLLDSVALRETRSAIDLCNRKQIYDESVNWVFGMKALKIIDKKFGYNYFS
jgi:tryptophan halogenase